jgi:hypothetical protein
MASKPNGVQDAKAGSQRPTGAGRLRWGIRFSPHVLVLPLALVAAIPAIRGTIVGFVHWWWDDTYAKVEYVMDEARPNDGYPYIAGHIEGSTEQTNLGGEMRGSTIVVEGLPDEAFAPGKRVMIWHSDAAPNFVVFGEDVNDFPVAARPDRPGLVSMLLHLAWLIGTLIVGLVVMVWVAKRWSGTWGDLAMRSRAGTANRL